MAGPPRLTGWKFVPTAGSERLRAQYNATTVFDFDANDLAVALATTFALAVTITAGGLTVTAGGATITAGGLTVTAGGSVVTAGDSANTAGNVRLGAIAAFGTTEPTQWVVMKSGTQPAGAITTSGGIGCNDTTVQKIIAAGTINNVET